jgi:16S rRNA (cytidine1402-2'-O)-methyltransferase
VLRDQLADHSVKDAVAHAVVLSGRPRREVYARALELAKEAHAKQTRAKAGDGED